VSRIRIAPIVEGHGEVECVRTLLDRVWREICGGEYAEVLRPIRRPRSKVIRYDRPNGRITADAQEMRHAVETAARLLHAGSETAVLELVLLMLDADEDCPKEILEAMRSTLDEVDPRLNVAAVFPCIEYETWFVASAAVLTDFLTLTPDDVNIEDPESARRGKSWIEQRFTTGSYSETVDQVKLTAAMDLQLCRDRCQSFDKLCRELERLRGQEPRP